jgi:hypothetical protein
MGILPEYSYDDGRCKRRLQAGCEAGRAAAVRSQVGGISRTIVSAQDYSEVRSGLSSDEPCTGPLCRAAVSRYGWKHMGTIKAVMFDFDGGRCHSGFLSAESRWRSVNGLII